MPLQQCQVEGVRGWKWGRVGKCYVGSGARAKAVRQGRAIETSVAENKEQDNEAGQLLTTVVSGNYEPGNECSPNSVANDTTLNKELSDGPKNRRKSVGSDGSLSTDNRHSNQGCGCSGNTNNESGKADSRIGEGSVTATEGDKGIETNGTKDSAQRITNQRKRKRVSFANPLRLDPTRTTTLRRIFEQAVSARFLKLKGAILRLVVDEDAFGLRRTFNQEELSDERSIVLSGKQYKGTRGEMPGYAALIGAVEGPHINSSSDGTLYKGSDGEGVVTGEGSSRGSTRSKLRDNQTLNKELSDADRRIQPVERGDTGESGKRGKVTREDKGIMVSDRGAGESANKTRKDSSLGVQNRSVGWVENQRFAFQSTPQQVQAFNAWLQTQIQADIITTTAAQAENAYWTKYVQQGYEKGVGRAFDDANVARRAQAGGSQQLGFIEGTREQFLQSAFAQPVAIDKVKILAGRVFTELNNVTTSMATTMSRTLVDGLARGDNPRKIARDLNKAVGIGRTRSRAIAQTEIIRAHAEGQLDAMEQMGMEKVGVRVEWSAAGDDRTCPRCLDLDGVVLKLKEARGIIPRHVNCRCTFIPANVGESTEDQIRGKANIQKAISDSIRVDIPKGRVIKGVGRRYKDPETGLFTSTTKRTLAQQKKISKWPGADLRVAKKRPKGLAND